MDTLDKFIEEIIDQKRLSGITEEAKQGLIEEMRERLVDMINRALIEALPEDKVATFSELLDGDNVTDEQVQAFIADAGVDTERITAKVLLDFRALFLQPSSSSQTE